MSLFLGWLSWAFVEERYRHRDFGFRKTFVYGCSATLFVLSVSSLIWKWEGLPSRESRDLLRLVDQERMINWPCAERRRLIPALSDSFCVIGESWDEAKLKGVVWGDSHSEHWAQIFDRELMDVGGSFVIAPRGCPPYLDSKFVKSHYPQLPSFTEDCTEKNRAMLDWVSRKDSVRVVVLAAAWAGQARLLYTESEPTNRGTLSFMEKSASIGSKLSEPAIRALLTKLKGKEVLLLADVPSPNRYLNECAYAEDSRLLRAKCQESWFKSLDAVEVSNWHSDSDEALRKIAAEFKNVSALFPGEALCDEFSCETHINGELIYADASHIRINLGNDTVKMLSQKIGLHDFFVSLDGSRD